jgi:hypothetical protein
MLRLAVGKHPNVGGNTGVVKDLDDSLGKLAASQDDIQFQSMIFDIKRYQDKIIRDPNKNDMDEIKMVFENLILVANDSGKQAAADYFSLYESVAKKLLRVVTLKTSIDQLNNKDLEDKHELLGRALNALVAKTHEEMIRDSSEAAAMEKNVKLGAIIICIVVIGFSSVFGYFFSAISIDNPPKIPKLHSFKRLSFLTKISFLSLMSGNMVS